jgi:hypothetical protein
MKRWAQSTALVSDAAARLVETKDAVGSPA